MKRIILHFLLIFFIGFGYSAQGQITLSPSDTTVCPGNVYSIQASFPIQWSMNNTGDSFGNIVNIGFPFKFYNQTHTQLVISSNNFLSFDVSLANQYSYFQYEAAIQNNQLNKAIMFPFQDLDLSLNQGFIRYQLLGTAPNRMFVIEFCQVPLWGCFNLPKATSQLILYETSNIIEMHIKEKPGGCSWWGGTAVQGLRYRQNASTIRENFVTGRDAPNVPWNASMDAKRFVPSGNTNYIVSNISYAPISLIVNANPAFIKWYAEGSATQIGSGSSINVVANPNNVHYYVAKITGLNCSDTTSLMFTDTSWARKAITHDTIYASTCGESYSFYGRTLTQTGVYDSLFISSGCTDSTVRLNLIVRPVDTATIVSNLTGCDSVIYQGFSYTSNITLLDTILNQFLCDSIYKVTNITINHPSTPQTIFASICQGESYPFNGVNYTSSTIVSHTFQNVKGCDSIVNLNLSVGSYISSIFDTTICQGKSIVFNGNTYSSSISSSQQINDTIPGLVGCDSIKTLVLTVSPYLTGILTKSVCHGGSYTFKGVTYSTSVTLAMGVKDTVQNAAGCDSIISFVLNVKPYKTGTFTSTICQGQGFTFNGNTYTTPVTIGMGIKDTVQTAAGCDSIVSLVLNVSPYKNGILTKSICQGQSYVFNGQSYTSEVTLAMGIKDTVQTAAGCDSIVSLVLNVTSLPLKTFNATICQGQTVSYNGQTYNSSTIFYDTFQTAQGCDSIVKVTIVVVPFYTSNLNVSICQGQTYTFNGVVYTASVSGSQGVKDTFQTAAGCDSIVTFTLTVKPYKTKTLTKTICQGSSFTYKGVVYTNPVPLSQGVKDTFPTASGCDSIVSLVLNVTPPLTSTLKKTICSGSSFSFNGVSYTTSVPLSMGIKDTFSTSKGCDSVVSLRLIVKPPVTSVSDTIHGCGVVNYNGVSYNSTVIKLDTFKYGGTQCDSLYRSRLIWVHPDNAQIVVLSPSGCGSVFFEGVTYTSTSTLYDTFYTQFGCDSVYRKVNVKVFPNIVPKTINKIICQGQVEVFNNISFTNDTIVTHTFTSLNGCDSTVTLNLSVSTYLSSFQNKTICQGQSYVFNGITYTNSVAPQDNIKDTFTTTSGCDSIVTLVLTVTPSIKKTITKTICQGKFYTFNGINYYTPIPAAAGIKDTFQTAQGCDSIVTLVLNVTPYLQGTFNKTICAGQNYTFNGISYSSSISLINGVKDTIQNASGCDSIISLILTVKPYPLGTFNKTICQGDSIVFKGVAYYNSVPMSAGISDTVVNAAGCDSIVRLNLTVNPIYTTVLNEGMCIGSIYYFNQQNLTTNGTYYDTLLSSKGCDSFIVLNLTVDTVITKIIYMDLCVGQNYVFGGLTLTVPGIYYDKFTSTSGCDSIVELHLNFFPPTFDTIAASICANSSYILGTQTLTTPGTYTEVFTSYLGCDSTVTLNLIVNPIKQKAITVNICAGQTFYFNGQNIAVQGTYKDTLTSAAGCDSIITLTLKVRPIYTTPVSQTICFGETFAFNGQNLSSTGLYKDTLQSVYGCDSFIHLTLIVLPAPLVNNDTIIACWNTSFQGTTYTSTTLVTDTFSYQTHACDSAYTKTYILIHPVDTQSVTIVTSGCGQVVFEGQTYTSSINLQDTLSNQFNCDSVYRFIQITVHPIQPVTLIDTTICNGTTYNFHGQIYSQTTNVFDTLSDVNSCDSVVNLNLVVLPPPSVIQDTIIACWSTSFQGITYTSTTLVTDTFSYQTHACDSAYTKTYVLIHPVDTQSVTIVTSGCGQVVFEGQTYTSSINLQDTLSNQFSCDSVYRFIQITVHPIQPVTLIDTTICNGMTYNFHGQIYSQTTNVFDTLSDVNSCDSVVNLNLVVLPPPSVIQDTIIACWSTSFQGITYTSTTLVTDTFSYQTHACDSAYTKTYILIHPVDTQSVTIVTSGCGQVVFEGQTYTSSINLQDTLSNQFSCDSVYRFIQITVHPIQPVTLIDTTICNGMTYNFHGQVYSQTTNVFDTLSDVNSCDSVVNLNLVVLPPPLLNNDTVIACWSINFQGTTYTSTTLVTDTFSYQTHACDSAYTETYILIHPVDTQSVTLTSSGCGQVVFEGQTYTSSINLQDTLSNQFSCDSVYRFIQITVHPIQPVTLIDTTICNGMTYNFHGQIYSQTTNVFDTLSDVNSCDSVVNLNLVVLPPPLLNNDTVIACWSINFQGTTYTSTTLVTDTFSYQTHACDSAFTETYILIHPVDTQSVTLTSSGCGQVVFEGQTYTSSINLQDTLSNQFNCDSVYRFIQITVHPIQPVTLIDTTICNGMTYNFHGQIYSQTTNVFDTLSDVNSCDSVVNLNLIVLPPPAVLFDTLHACWSTTFNGATFTTSTAVIDTLIDLTHDCDSVYRNVYLLIYPADTQRIALNMEGCNELVFEGNTYYQSVFFTDTSLNQFGCDSLYRDIDIIIHHVQLQVVNIDTAGCGSVYFEGVTYYENQTITDVYKDIHGCDSLQRNVHVNINEIIYDTFKVDICIGESYEYNGESYSTSGYYSHVFESYRGCDSTVTLVLDVHPLPSLQIVYEPIINGFCLGDSVLVEGKGAIDYHWYSDKSMDWGIGNEMYVFLPRESNWIRMYGTDEWGCSDTVSISINTEPCCDVFVPNAFSPNGDGLNDIFKVESEGHPYEFQLNIFNRLGQKVFQSFNLKDGWDGSINGKIADPGVYHFYIIGKCVDGSTIKQKGDLTLIR